MCYKGLSQFQSKCARSELSQIAENDCARHTGKLGPGIRDSGPWIHTWDPGPGALHLGPRTRDSQAGPRAQGPGPLLAIRELGHKTFACSAGPILSNPYINTTFSSCAVQQHSVVVSNRQLHKFVQYDRAIHYANKNIIVYLPFWLFSYIFKNHKLVKVWATLLQEKMSLLFTFLILS